MGERLVLPIKEREEQSQGKDKETWEKKNNRSVTDKMEKGKGITVTNPGMRKLPFTGTTLLGSGVEENRSMFYISNKRTLTGVPLRTKASMQLPG